MEGPWKEGVINPNSQHWNNENPNPNGEKRAIPNIDAFHKPNVFSHSQIPVLRSPILFCQLIKRQIQDPNSPLPPPPNRILISNSDLLLNFQVPEIIQRLFSARGEDLSKKSFRTSHEDNKRKKASQRFIRWVFFRRGIPSFYFTTAEISW